MKPFVPAEKPLDDVGRTYAAIPEKRGMCIRATRVVYCWRTAHTAGTEVDLVYDDVSADLTYGWFTPRN